MASYGGVSTSTSLGRPISSLDIAQNNQVSAPLGQNQQQWSGAIPQGVQLPYTQGTSDIPLDQALNRVFPGGIPAAMEQYLTPTMEPDISSFRRQSGQSPLDSVISLQQLRSDVMARYTGYQVEPSEPAPTKPISLGLANFQQAKPEKEANHQSGTDWSQTRAGSPQKRSVSLRGSSANFNLQYQRFSPSSQIWIGGLPGCQTSPKIFSLTYLIARISS